MEMAALRACVGVVALCWGMAAFAQPLAGTAAAPGTSHPNAKAVTTPPSSIRLLPAQTGLAGTCGGSAFTVNTFINVTAQSSADVKVSAPGVGTIEEFTDETGKNIGPYNAAYPAFQILAFGGGLAPNTLITISITTYTGPALSGSVGFVSTLEFNCTNGGVVATAPAPPSALPTPTLSPLALLATAALLALLAALALRPPARPRRVRR